jgi:hypothetical protein
MRFRDGDWWLVSHDFAMKRTVWARENDDGTTTYRTDYEVDPTIEANKATKNMASSGWAGDYHLIASIPAPFVYGEGYIATALREGDDTAVSRWLNDSDNSAFRTKEGRV